MQHNRPEAAWLTYMISVHIKIRKLNIKNVGTCEESCILAGLLGGGAGLELGASRHCICAGG